MCRPQPYHLSPCCCRAPPDLYTAEEKDEIISGCRAAAKAAGLVDTNENVWRFFIQRVSRLGGAWAGSDAVAQPGSKLLQAQLLPDAQGIPHCP